MDNLPGETLEDTFEIRGSRLTDMFPTMLYAGGTVVTGAKEPP